MNEPDFRFMDNVSNIISENKENKYGHFLSKFLQKRFVRESRESNIYYTPTPKKLIVLGRLLAERGSIIFIKNFCENYIYSLKVDDYSLITVIKVSDEIYKLISRNPETNAFKPIIDKKYFNLDFYRALYNPCNVSDFRIKDERIYYDNNKLPFYFGKEHDLKEFPEIITNGVYVGYYAMKYFNQEYEGPIEIISCYPSDILIPYQKKYNITTETLDIPIFKDIFLTRTLINKAGKTIAIIYNSAEYELIPFIPKKIKIATLPVLLRFLLIKSFLSDIKLEKSDYVYYHDNLLNEPIHPLEFIPEPENYYGIVMKTAYLYEKKCKKSRDFMFSR